MADQAFAGFPRGTFTFLRDLAANNNKAWFDAHRQDYEDYYIAPAMAFVQSLGPRLKKIAPGIQSVLPSF